MNLIILTAVSENNVIGYNGIIPWYIPEDLKRFKELTLGHPVIMGRKTYDSILERQKKPLKKRVNIVLTNKPIKEKRVLTANNLEDALSKAKKSGEDIYVIGGHQVYREFLPFSNKIELTRVYKNVKGDTFFPPVNWSEWNKTFMERHKKFSFETYERK